MRRLALIPILCLCLAMACNLLPGQRPAPTAGPVVPEASVTPDQVNVIATATPPAQNQTPSTFFTDIAWQSSSVSLQHFSPGVYTATLDKLPLALDLLANPEVTRGLSEQQMDFLGFNGFVVLATADEQFSDIRDQVAQVNGQPYYLTTDAAFHALHVSFNDLLAAVEKEALSPVLGKLLDSLAGQLDQYAGQDLSPELMGELSLAQNYLAVARRLLDPSKPLISDREAQIAAQMAQIAAMEGKQDSALIPGFIDDYGAYRPVGHYAGDPLLERYFQTMTWLGRVAFPLAADPSRNIIPSRTPLFITLALRDAQVDGVPAHQVWSNLYAITDFMIGPSDDPGPIELNALMESVYGSEMGLADLADQELWQEFLDRVPELAAPQINSTFQDTSLQMAFERDWRLMGQRFTLDGLIFQQLISDKVERRFFPTGMDIPAAFGSQTAVDTLFASGQMDFPNYEQQLKAMQALVQNMPQDFWSERFYNNWLYAFQSQVSDRGDAFPPYMTLPPWGFKQANSVLGSWTELKHDTILYSKMPEGLGGGGPPTSPPTPSYVEPNPDVFLRLAYAARNLHDGLESYLQDWESRGWYSSPFDDTPGTYEYQSHLERLAEHLDSFSQIAQKELRGERLTEEENAQILSCLELKDCLTGPYYNPEFLQPDPIPLVAAVSGYENEILEAAIGQLQRIYVAVPINGTLQIAQGGIFSYYEFIQSRNDRLTDEAWRTRLASNPPNPPAWSAALVLPGGSATEALAFRIGDIYTLTEEGSKPPLNLRAQPSRSAEIVAQLDQNAYLEIIAGPTVLGQETWWQVRNLNDEMEGWVLQNQDWFARSY